MKKFLLAALVLTGLASCSPPTPLVEVEADKPDPTHAAVTAHLKKTLDDPASYQPAHWGKVEAFTQKQVDVDNATAEQASYQNQLDIAKIHSGSYIRLLDIGADKQTLATTKHRRDVFVHRADSVSKLMEKLASSTDNTQLGMSVVHAFRAKNKMGATVLDSARFIVFKSGEVTALKLN